MPIFNSTSAWTFFSVLGLVACGQKDQPSGRPSQVVTVAVQTATQSDAVFYDEFPATVKALSEVELRPQVNGYITGIHFKEGSRVTKGQKLYSIDPQQSQAAYQSAVANLSIQEANLTKARGDVERYRELDAKDAIARQQVDYAEAAYVAAQKQVEAAKASVRSVQTNVRYTTIVAPFDGTIGISQVRLGAAVTPGQTLLNTISTDDPMAVEIAVDQQEINRFNELLSKGPSSESDTTFRLAFRDGVYPAAGRLVVIDRAVDERTGTIRMRFEFPNRQHTLRAGMTGTLKVLTAVKQMIIIPYKAVNEQLGEFFVYVADNNKATQRKVVLGKQLGRDIIIKSGLKEGETIITEGLQNLREGSDIQVGTTASNH